MTTVTEEPLDRLNYFNGQRLDAKDLQIEQDYHIRVRRQLNQALDAPGIARGLEVLVSQNAHAVTVNPGVALDAFGREVILLEPTEVHVCGLPNTDPAWVYGNFLFIEYAEEETAVESAGCTVACGKTDLAWGGPTRIRAVPTVGFADAWPNEQEGRTILAQVELDPACAVVQILNAPRKYVDAAKAATRAISLEGEKDIDQHNSKKLSFHVIGGPAKSVTLYLWGERLSTLWYTEIGAHSHGIDDQSTSTELYTDGTTSQDLGHRHQIENLGDVIAGEEGSDAQGDQHAHEIEFPYNNNADKSKIVAINVDQSINGDMTIVGHLDGTITGGAHTHELVLPADGVWTADADASMTLKPHRHTFRGTTEIAGKTVVEQTAVSALTYIDDLEVYLDGDRITEQVRAQLGWDKLGDGTSAHALVSPDGTGPIALERIAAINQGVHLLEFRITNDSGGNVRYNLYAE